MHKGKKPGVVGAILDALVQAGIGSHKDIDLPSDDTEARAMRRRFVASAAYRHLPISTRSLDGKLRVTYLGARPVRREPVSPPDEEASSLHVTLRVNPRLWERLVLMASKTGCGAYKDPRDGKALDPISPATPEVFASDLLEVGIVEMWQKRGYAAERGE